MVIIAHALGGRRAGDGPGRGPQNVLLQQKFWGERRSGRTRHL